MTFRTFIRPECLGVDHLSYARISAICRLTSKLSCGATWRALCSCKGRDKLPRQLQRFVRRHRDNLDALSIDHTCHQPLSKLVAEITLAGTSLVDFGHDALFENDHC